MLEAKLAETGVSGHKLVMKLYKRRPNESTVRFQLLVSRRPSSWVTVPWILSSECIWKMSRSFSTSSPAAIGPFALLLRLATQLYETSGLQPQDVRGIGLSVHELQQHVVLNAI